MYKRTEAIEIMNLWGRNRFPFLFIIDFEMEAIRLYQHNEDFPDSIKFSLPGTTNSFNLPLNKTPYTFKKIPVPFANYERAFDKVIHNIKSGNSFLLNLTFPTQVETDLSLNQIFTYSKSKYKLLIDNEFVVFSPETFVRIDKGLIYSYPMKGTINALLPDAEKIILENHKEMAEHFTIVDLIRNDLSTIASDVHVSRFRYIDRINTNFGDILQVSSEIVGKLPNDYLNQLGSIVFSLLPAGSVTGAPKPKTLQIIKEVEASKRGYYTGIFGYFDGQSLDSAVMIRFIENKDNSFWFRSGGGITFQSDVTDEYNELVRKVYVPIS
jgi:para-aminobenzoate synthetase component 1